MNIFNAYLHYALVIAIFHGLLSLLCVVCFIVQSIQLKRERASFGKLFDSGFGNATNDGTEMSRVTKLTLTMTRKGEIPNPEAIRSRLLRHLAKYDVIIRFCLNAFIISGLLGTLFNLWKLGPSFWAGIISGKQVGGQPAIGIAFSASVFGLGLALIFSFVDSLGIRFRRDAFVVNASAALFDVAATLIPPTERAAVAEALQKFYADSEGLLNKFRSEHDELSRKFISQIQNSSDKLNETMVAISDRWSDLIGNTATTVGEFGDRVSAAANDLTKATANAEQALTSTLPLLRKAEDLSTTLLQIRLQTEKLQAQVTTELSKFGEKWQADLLQAYQSHDQKMGEIYARGLSQFDESARSWHTKNVTELDRFSGNLENSIKQWSEERQRVGQQLDNQIESWRRELSRATTGVGTGLSNLGKETEALKFTSEQLAKTQAAAFQQLQSLQIEVAAFSRTVLEGTPLGTAIEKLDASISEFCLRVNPGDTDSVSQSLLPSADSESIPLILQELKTLSAKVSGPRLPEVLRPPGPDQAESEAVNRPPATAIPRQRSLWERLTAPFRGNS
jgi:gas vesicle protein